MTTLEKLMIGGLSLLASGCMMQAQTTFDSATLANHATVAAQGTAACTTAMAATDGADALHTLDPENIDLFVWNIHKNQHPEAAGGDADRFTSRQAAPCSLLVFRTGFSHGRFTHWRHDDEFDSTADTLLYAGSGTVAANSQGDQHH